jgi:hypothetical protein
MAKITLAAAVYIVYAAAEVLLVQDCRLPSGINPAQIR